MALLVYRSPRGSSLHRMRRTLLRCRPRAELRGQTSRRDAALLTCLFACLLLLAYLLPCFLEKGSVESTHKVPTSHYRMKHCHAASLLAWQPNMALSSLDQIPQIAFFKCGASSWSAWSNRVCSGSLARVEGPRTRAITACGRRRAAAAAAQRRW